MMQGGRIVIVAPESFRPLTRRLAGRRGPAAFTLRRRARRRHSDPFDLAGVAESTGAAAMLLVAPPGWAPEAAAPGPVVAGIPVGTVFARRPADLEPWMRARHRRTTCLQVMAGGLERYDRLAALFCGRLRRRGIQNVMNLSAARIDRPTLMAELGRAGASRVYVGHSYSSGLCAYMGFFWEHVVGAVEIGAGGAFLCFSCDTLKREDGDPFGVRWVRSGRAAAWLGSVTPTSTAANRTLARAAAAIIADLPAATVGDVVVRTGLSVDRKAQEVLAGYRIIGNPLQPIAPPLLRRPGGCG